MGTEAAWVPLVISAIGAGASAYNQHNVAKQQKEEATNLMVGQQKKQKIADERINQELTDLSSSNPEAERQKALDGFLSMLRANSSQATGGESPVTGSARFATDSAASKGAIQDYGTGRADTLSRIVAPTRQRTNEAVNVGRMQDDVSGVARDANAERFLSELRMQSIRPNEWIDAGAGILKGAGAGMASYYNNLPDVSGATGTYVAPTNSRVWGGSGSGSSFSPPPR